jgi:hypothetical protein
MEQKEQYTNLDHASSIVAHKGLDVLTVSHLIK